MKRLREHCTIQEADEIAAFFRSRGIVTFISNKDTAITGSHTVGASSVSIWVVLRNQYDDAFALLDNKSHEVSSGLSESELVKLEKTVAEFKPGSLSGLYRGVGYVLLGSAVLIGGIFSLAHFLS